MADPRTKSPPTRNVPVSLAAGPLSMSFEPRTAFLRWISLGDVEIVRGVFAAVRDADWDTVPFELRDLYIEQSRDAFDIRFHAASLRPDVPFQWHGHLTGSSRGCVHYEFKGQAQDSFLRNRIGLCVLHPIALCAGAGCRVEHTDGRITDGIFPRWISPHQPFKQMRSITYSVRPHLDCRVMLEGDVFEMEDQRNWTDASYKTYSTPLELPFPVRVATGETVEQSVTIELLGRVPRVSGARSIAVHRVAIDWDHPQPRPAIGFLLPHQSGDAPLSAVERLRQIQPDHLRFDVRLDDDSWHDRVERAIDVARRTGAALEVALFMVDDAWQPRLRACLERLKSASIPMARWLVLHAIEKTTPWSLGRSAAGMLRRSAPSVPIVVGTDAYFAELNRNRPQPIDGGPVCYSINPQVHACDNDSLSETLEAQRWTVDSAVEYFGTDVVVSPITLRPRFNPNATSRTIELRESLESAIDPRQKSGFGAAWTAGVLAALAVHPRVQSLTFYEAYGPRGIIDGQGNDYPPTPLLELILACRTVFQGTSTRAHDVSAFGALDGAGRRHVVLANLTDHELTVEFSLQHPHARRLTLAAESAKFVPLEGQPG